MCPMRFVLVFFSALLAGYVAWRTVRSSPEEEFISGDYSQESEVEQEFNFKRMVKNCFWVFVDMASGKYLWRNLKEMNKEEKAKSC